MPYYPKSKIQTNLFSNGDLIRSSDFTSYVGPYYKLSTGDRFVGQNPQALRYPELLIDLKDFQQSSDLLRTKQAPNFSTLTELGNYTQNLKEQYVSRKVPTPYYPQPSQQDYQVGYFTRYFAKQANDTTFIETNQSTFENLAQHNSEYLWELYNVISLPWQINGNVENVFKTNRNIVRLEEKNGFRGLSKFLNENYIKFYTPLETSNLYTEGNEFKTQQGQNYIGFYHIHKGTIPMVGKVHTKEAHEVLIPLNNSISPKIKPQISNSISGSTIPSNPVSSFGGGSGGGGGY